MTERRRGAMLRAFALLWIGLLVGFSVGIEWIKGRPADPPRPSGGIDLVGAGATLPYPLYRRWFAEYGAASGVRINYFSVGSGEGIRLLLTDRSADFGATDRPLTTEERGRASCGPIDIPTVAGAVSVAYNLPGVATPLRLDADVLAEIFLGRIGAWNAAQLRALNPGVALPSLPIQVIRRAQSSGTGAVFARYLAPSVAWRAAHPHAGALASTWPVGATVEGNEGVAAQVRVTAGAIGFVEFSYAKQARLQVAALRNASGAFVSPDAGTVTAAVEEILTPANLDTLVAIVGARSPRAYAVAALTRIVADSALADPTKGAHLLAFIRWALDDGARTATELGYAPLPAGIVRRLEDRLARLEPGRCPAGAAR